MSNDQPPVIHLVSASPDPDTVFEELLEYPWKPSNVTMFGKTSVERRKVLWYGPKGCIYKYGGKKMIPKPMTGLLKDLGEYAGLLVEQELARVYVPNSVFCNLYKDGADYIGWHADDEPIIDSDVIVSYSFGSARDFKVRHEKNKKVWTYPLDHGDVAIMYGDCQKKYKHSVPQRKKVDSPRINLTYRLVNQS